MSVTDVLMFGRPKSNADQRRHLRAGFHVLAWLAEQAADLCGTLRAEAAVTEHLNGRPDLEPELLRAEVAFGQLAVWASSMKATPPDEVTQ